MSTLYVVRHGQASLDGPDYDALSVLGWEQAKRLGEHWAAGTLRPDHVFVGPRRRHKETEQAVRAAYESAGLSLPEAREAPGLDEFPGLELMGRAAPELAASDAEAKAWFEQAGGGGPDAVRALNLLFLRVATLWAKGELAYDDIETFSAFRTRVLSFVRESVLPCVGGKTVLVHTSGGPVGVMVGMALGVDPERVMELVAMVRNASWTQFRFTEGRISLEVFNVHPHLQGMGQVTHI